MLFLFGIALGITGAALVLRLGPAAEWFVWPIPALLSPFAGVFYPLATLPGWMRGDRTGAAAVVRVRGDAGDRRRPPFSGGALLWSGALAVLYVLLASWIFSRVHRHAVRTGLIARYSAETVS